MKGDKVTEARTRLCRALQTIIRTLAFVLSSWKAVKSFEQTGDSLGFSRHHTGYSSKGKRDQL